VLSLSGCGKLCTYRNIPLIITKYYYDDNMGRACIEHGTYEKCVHNLGWERVKEKSIRNA
jgi:hypothetical protein